MAGDMLTLTDGTPAGALKSLSYSCTVSAREDLYPGSACAAMVEAEVWSDAPPVTQGTGLDYYRDGILMGRFYCEKPRRTGTNRFRITGYDAMIRFDRDIGAWLRTVSWPTTLGTLLTDLCAHCGVPLDPGCQLPRADLQIPELPLQSLSGRQLLDWIGQAAGRYFTVTPAGYLRPGWYASEPVALGGSVKQVQLPDGVLADCFTRIFAVRAAIPYRLDGLKYSDFTTAPVERVWIRSGESDVGVVWPDGSDATANTLVIQGNPLLESGQGGSLQTTAGELYAQFREAAYTPFTCTLMPGYLLMPGSRVSFTDAEGNTHTAPVMEMKLENGCCTVTATGNPSLQSTTAFNQLSVGQVLGRVLSVERTAQGLQVVNSDMSGAMASLKLTVEGLTTRVAGVETEGEDHADAARVSQLEQRADALELTITRIREDTDGKAEGEDLEEIRQIFLFDENGLTISNTGTGMGIGISQERIIFTGGTDPTTQITPNEMATTNLRVGRRLDLGNFSLIPRTNGNLSLRYTAGASDN